MRDVDRLLAISARRARRAVTSTSPIRSRWNLLLAERAQQRAYEVLLAQWGAPAVGGYPRKDGER